MLDTSRKNICNEKLAIKSFLEGFQFVPTAPQSDSMQAWALCRILFPACMTICNGLIFIEANSVFFSTVFTSSGREFGRFFLSLTKQTN